MFQSLVKSKAPVFTKSALVNSSKAFSFCSKPNKTKSGPKTSEISVNCSGWSRLYASFSACFFCSLSSVLLLDLAFAETRIFIRVGPSMLSTDWWSRLKSEGFMRQLTNPRICNLRHILLTTSSLVMHLWQGSNCVL